MRLDLYLDLCPETIVNVFICITVMVVMALFTKGAIVSSKQGKSKEKKEVESDDNRGNQKRSTKTDVH